jgi:DNA invertase Pin-like site-specific DNA recombinase
MIDTMDEQIKRGRKNKLDEQQIEEIKKLLAIGIYQKTIARKYGVSPMTISKINCANPLNNKITITDTTGIKIQL